MKELIIKETNQNQRLDKYLGKVLNQAPSSMIHKLLRKKNIKLNGKKSQGNEMLKFGDHIQLYLADDTLAGFIEEKKSPKKTASLDVVYEDENILICNKPAGLLSHSQSRSDDDTMIDRILFYLYKTGKWPAENTLSPGNTALTVRDFTPALCNRLDRNTSGLVICGKNLNALQELNALMAERKIDKYYLTLVQGRIQKSGSLQGFHLKNEANNKAEIGSTLSPGGKQAITEYTPIKIAGDFSLLRIRLVTGKSHQIRVHMQEAGHPIVGDPKYGDKTLNEQFRKEFGLSGQFLHAEKLILTQNAGRLSYLSGQEFSAPPSILFQTILRRLNLC